MKASNAPKGRPKKQPEHHSVYVVLLDALTEFCRRLDEEF